MSYVPLHCHSYYSLLDGLPSPKAMAKRAKDIGAPALALTDHGNIFGIVDHLAACKKVGIKPIVGIELYMCEQDPTIQDKTNNKRYHLTVLAKNQEGVRTLMEMVSRMNSPDWFYRKPRIDLNNLAQFAAGGNLICLSGCLGGELSTSLFVPEAIGNDGKKITGLNGAGRCGDDFSRMEEARGLLKPDWKEVACGVVSRYRKIFGKDNYYIEIQDEGMVAQRLVVECLRDVASGMGIPSVATLDAHYTCQEDSEDHQVLLCSQMHTTIEEQERMRAMGGDTMAFFYLDRFHLFDGTEMAQHYTQAEIETSLEIADKVDKVALGGPPQLPSFANDDMAEAKLDSDGYLNKLCLQAAKRVLGHLSADQKKIYWKRLKTELAVIQMAKLSDYFLIVWDACCFVDKHNGPRGKGRGSGAGSLVNYLLKITGLDPIEYGLYFERFYNAARNLPPHFDVGNTGFQDWYSDNFETLLERDTEKDKGVVRDAVERISNRVLLTEEAAWMDGNNPYMWSYLSEVAIEGKMDNPCNSHILFAMGLTDVLDASAPSQREEGHVSLPDIDVDIGVEFKTKIIAYLKERWGEDHVAQMITFGRLQGKAALKEVFRVRYKDVIQLQQVKAVKLGKKEDDSGLSPYDVATMITKHIPDEAAIADDLQTIRDAENNPDYGILQWAVHHIEEVGNAYEWYKPLFDQAMRIEGTKKAQSKHAAGIVIANRPISEIVPMAYDARSKDRVVGLEMASAEKLGAVKFDFLGVAALDKLWHAQDLVNQAVQEVEIVEDFVEDGDD